MYQHCSQQTDLCEIGYCGLCENLKTGLSWLMIKRNGSHLWTQYETLNSIIAVNFLMFWGTVGFSWMTMHHDVSFWVMCLRKPSYLNCGEILNIYTNLECWKLIGYFLVYLSLVCLVSSQRGKIVESVNVVAPIGQILMLWVVEWSWEMITGWRDHPSDLMWAPNHGEYEGVAGVHSPKTFSMSDVQVPVSQ